MKISFHRELDPRAPEFSLGSDPNSLRVLGTVNPEDSWDNIRTVVQVAADRAVVETEGKVYERNQPLTIPATISTLVPSVTTFICDLGSQPDNRVKSYVQSVIGWSAIKPAHFEFQRAGVVASLGLTIVLLKRGRKRTTVTITNTGATATLTKLELHGFGVALYGDLTVPDLDDPYAVALYGRRILSLPASFIGDGLNEGDEDDNAILEGNVHARLLLLRYARPQIHGRLRIDCLGSNRGIQAMVGINISDPIDVEANTGMPAGRYRVEGGTFQFDAGTGLAEMGINVSKRGEAHYLRDHALNFAPPDNAVWHDVDIPSFSFIRGEFYIVAVLVAFPSGTRVLDGGGPVLRLRFGVGATAPVIKTWIETSIPIGAPHWVTGLVEGDGVGMASVQARRRNDDEVRFTVTRLRFIRIVR